MINFVEKRKYYYIISGILVAASLLSFLVNGLKFSIDFVGGSEFAFTQVTNEKGIDDTFNANEIEIVSKIGEGDSITYKIQEISQDTREKVEEQVREGKYGEIEEFQTIGPVIGEETKSKATQAVLLAIAAILIYIAIVFRRVSRPLASWKFGVAAVAALVHDVLITLGVFSILGRVWGVEVDPLFITAILTVMGFSVHDTIVTFDRIRENLQNNVRNTPFDTVVNNSILETLTRSINTTMTVLFVLIALLVFGGESIRYFTLALTIGVVIGTYSSIFIASQLLVTWYEWDKKKNK